MHLYFPARGGKEDSWACRADGKKKYFNYFADTRKFVDGAVTP